MKSLYKLLVAVFFIATPFITTQAQKQNNQFLLKMSEELTMKYQEQKAKVLEYAKENNIQIREDDGIQLKELMLIDERGKPQYYITDNENAAKTISTNKVYSGGGVGFSLDGTGIIVYEWDGGTVLRTHQEFDTRLTNGDATATHYHATHVAGTIMASGVESAAKGMAFNASLVAYDWTDDDSEMAAAAANGALISNHSYGSVRGWYYDSGSGTWLWNGDTGISSDEDYLFGFYNSWAAAWDEIAYNAPNYLIIKSAGNDRNDTGSGHDPDGPWDCIGPKGIAKNVLTVGAVEDITGGYAGTAGVIATSFTSYGPADDGRIKPDIVANGSGLYSTYDTGDTDYASLSGTSMSSPSVTGSAALLIQHYKNIHGASSNMTAATLKALIINSADEAGSNDGPDYSFGWGLMNTQRAAEKITEDQTTDVILEFELLDGESYTRDIVTTSTNPITVTVVWTDPAGTPVSASLNPTDAMLVNDLDLKITQGGSTYYPWKLSAASPSSAATNSGENNVDNVEQVYIASPTDATSYTITIDHDGSLDGGSQAFSLIIDGDISNSIAPVADFSADNRTPADNTTVVFSDASANIPTTWAWSFSPSTVSYVNSTSSSSQNPEVEFTSVGTYQVSLTATNAIGSDAETKVAYIVVSDAPTGYCEAYSTNPAADIRRVQMGSIDKTSTHTNVGDPDPDDKYYEDWTAFSTDVIPGESYNITLSSIYSDGNIDLGIWCDWNRDGDFEDTGEEALCGPDNGGYGTFSINVPSYASLGKTRMRIRTRYLGTSCGSSCGSDQNGEVEDYTLNVIGAWTGATSTDWATATNWSQGTVPIASDNVLIPSSPSSGRFPLIGSGTSAICNDLEIEASASLSIRGSLTVNGTLTNTAGTSGIVIKSDASGSGSLIQSTASISATIERYMEAYSGDSDGWHFLSSPIATFNISGSEFAPGGSDDLYSWSESDGEWKNYKAGDPTQIVMGKGYLIARASTDTKDFSGVLNNADKTWLNLSSTPANEFSGWHLLGNPFSSAVSWGTASWNMSNIGATAKIYKESTGSYIDISEGATIPSTQGFMSYVASGTNSLTIPLSERMHSSQNWYKEEEVNKIKLIAYDTDGNTAQESIIRFNENATSDFDLEYDSYFFRGFAPAFYSVIPEGNLSTNTISMVTWETRIPFSFIKNNSSNYYIEVEGVNNLEPQESVFLTDLKLNHSQNLNTNPLYSFTSEEGDIAERFIIHFSALAIDDLEPMEQINVFAAKESIEIRSQKPVYAKVLIYNIAGQLLAQKQLNSESSSSINMRNFKGSALVTIISQKKTITTKVMVF